VQVEKEIIDLRPWIQDVPDFPKSGIVFKDITPLLQNPSAFRELIDQSTQVLQGLDFDSIAAIESRGFIFGAALAQRLNKGLILVRKPGKLPRETWRESYQLEYGEDALEIHRDACAPGQRILLVDDVLATGGTMKAAQTLVQKAGAEVAAVFVVIELSFLKGRDLLKPVGCQSLIAY
jgi:adenine phosphoribosyltransferase